MGRNRPSFPVFLLPDAEGFQEKKDPIIIREKLEHFDLPGYCFCPYWICNRRKSFSVPHY